MKYDDNGVWKTLNIKVTDTLPVGTIIPYAGTTIPSNYMLCEGQALSRIEYDILFNAIGTTYGVGDGTTTFNLPNLKGKVPVGLDSNDTDFDTLGETGGSKTHKHRQTDNFNSQYHNGNGYQYTVGGSPTNEPIYTYNDSSLQPYIVLNYIIKVLDAPATVTQAQVVDEYSTSTTD